MRVVQPGEGRGSLKWVQRAVAERWPDFEAPIVARLGGGEVTIDWVSPVADDDFAEYRDAAFLSRLGLDSLAGDLKAFWPERGPQWDALGLVSGDKVVLVEAKAHVGEFCTSPTGARPQSRAQISASLNRVAAELGSPHGNRWPDQFYQLTNRLAHLWFLRQAGVDAYLVLASFLDDAEMGGPSHPETWDGAYQLAYYVLGLKARHPLSRFLVHVHPSVIGHG